MLFPHPDVDKPTFKSLEILLIILLAFANIANIFMGIVTGVVSGLIFLAVNFCFLRDENRYKLFFKRLVSYLLILLISSILFAKGGDWIFELTEYFKNKG
ncbi:hypothetical protein [Pedobacter sp. SL55]|uniref:hypothetical protein n=1 Tax=Pedobacter sp. SL55 TaxID=2995161 RepID=UPI00226EC2E4|nr:hypothetical protein [Pedobacter sp. SL55]WAC42553.1 hypothetical protein OVA16_09425 [Pedobacter sp. SL55]